MNAKETHREDGEMLRAVCEVRRGLTAPEPAVRYVGLPVWRALQCFRVKL